MKYKEIAVVGMSMRFAGVNDIADYHDMLTMRKSGMGTSREKRLKLVSADENAESIIDAGYSLAFMRGKNCAVYTIAGLRFER